MSLGYRFVIFLVFLLAISSLPAMAQEALFSKSYALLIGIDRYQHPKVWETLPYATKDAGGMVDFLRGQGFEVKTLYNHEATRGNIVSWLEDDLARRLTENDRVLFFFSGHGETISFGEEEHGYIIPYEGTNRSSSWISMEKLRELSSKMVNARHQLFIFDSCFGGLFATKSRLSSISPDFPGYVDKIARQKARQYLTAGGRGEKVRATGPHGYSNFTGHLIEALKGNADTSPDGIITATELAAYLGPAASNDDHTPRGGTFAGHQQGEFFFLSPVPAVNIANNAKSVTTSFTLLKNGQASEGQLNDLRREAQREYKRDIETSLLNDEAVQIIAPSLEREMSDGLRNGLLLHYPFEEDLVDLSGNGYNGIERKSVSYINGVKGKAVSLNGKNYISIPQADSLMPREVFSISVWVNFHKVPKTWTGNKILANSSGDAGAIYGYWLDIIPQDRRYSSISMRARFMTGSGEKTPTGNDMEGFVGDKTIKLNEWVHILAVFEDRERSIYMNGKKIGNSRIQGTSKTSRGNVSYIYSIDELLIGKWYKGRDALVADLDELRMYERALTQPEIKRLYLERL